MRSRRGEVRLRWPVLVSALLHLLAVLGLNLLPTPTGGPRLQQETSSIRVSFPSNSETPRPEQKSDGAQTDLMPDSEVGFGPDGERAFEPSIAQVSEASKPPDPRPPTSITPQPTPSIPPSPLTAPEVVKMPLPNVPPRTTRAQSRPFGSNLRQIN
jgi:hypothetical protein